MSRLTSFMPPMALQTIWVLLVLTSGDAMAAPRNNANHTSTKRVIQRALRRACMVRLSHFAPGFLNMAAQR